MTNREMITEMLDRFQGQIENMQSTVGVIEALDRDGDFDLHDQIATADGLMDGLQSLLQRMRNVNG